MSKLQGQNVLITGGTSGIGLATARLFLEEGANLLVTGLEDSHMAEAKKLFGGKVQIMACDAGNLESIAGLVKQVKTEFGRLDALFLNAGFARYSNLASLTEGDFDRAFAVHVKGPLFSIQAFAPDIRDGGSIVITTSNTDRMGMTDSHIYAASKAAARQLVKTLAKELAPRNIRVNALCPGPVKTNIGETLGYTPAQIASMEAYVTGKVPLARFAEPEEMARTVLYLTCDATFTTGEEIVCDGGWTEINQ